VRVLVIGDSCKDVFDYGFCERLAPAAPVPVFVSRTRKSNKGMAGNVFENLINLGLECDIITNKKEIVKTRFVDEETNHMIMRLDSGEENLERISNLHLVPFEKYDAIVLTVAHEKFITLDLEILKSSPSFVYDVKTFQGFQSDKVL